jgi:hypothetical protein
VRSQASSWPGSCGRPLCEGREPIAAITWETKWPKCRSARSHCQQPYCLSSINYVWGKCPLRTLIIPIGRCGTMVLSARPRSHSYLTTPALPGECNRGGICSAQEEPTHGTADRFPRRHPGGSFGSPTHTLRNSKGCARWRVKLATGQVRGNARGRMARSPGGSVQD